MALQIQQDEAPLYDNVLVCFGAFHVTLAYFSAVGHIIAESGGPQALVETNVLASGSLNGFITGRHYNMCKWLHVLPGDDMHILHFCIFILQEEPLSPEFHDQLQKLQDDPSPDHLETLEHSDLYADIMQRYREFTNCTHSGEHWSNAQFWLMYIELVELYLRFTHAVRTKDLDLYTYCLGEMCGIFVATSHPNYARYMVRFHLNLLNIDYTHPGIWNNVMSGALSIKCTKKNFTGTAVDQTLEQTINADAASRLTGIAAFTSSAEAWTRWMVTHSARSSLTGHFLEMAGLKPKEDSSKELNSHRIDLDHDDLTKVTSFIQDTLNPFITNSGDDNL